MNIYAHTEANIRKTWIYLAGFFILVILFGWVVSYILGSQIILIIAVVLSVVMSFGSYWYSHKIVLAMSKAKAIEKKDMPELYRIVENLAITAGLPKPGIYVIKDPSPNAFATGRNPKHASIAVTTGWLERLEKNELEGVIAHELSHIGNYDIRVMTIVVVLVGLSALMADFALRLTFYGAGRRSSNRGRGGGAAVLIIYAIALIAIILTPIAAQLIRFAVSRQREFLADASGALLCRNPDALARALEKISADPDPLEVANKATAHLYINNPLREHKSLLNGMFATHPPIEERVRLLRAMT
ncbi:M48 family metalloprotease [Patescibacteria group bacterium]|nr:M48 family metalloprotease [Patescibacteria group bacterium]